MMKVEKQPLKPQVFSYLKLSSANTYVVCTLHLLPYWKESNNQQEVVTGISDTHEACTCCECTMKFWNSEMETFVNCYKFAGKDYVHKFFPNNILNEQCFKWPMGFLKIL
jgi:hypothetical protein